MIGCTFIRTEENASTKISKYIKKNGLEKDSSFYCRLSEIFDFPWDTMYLFNPNNECWEIEKIMRIKYECEEVEEKSYRLIFIKNHNIVYKNDCTYRTYNDKIAVDIHRLIDTTSYSKEEKAYTERLFYFTKETDSMLIEKRIFPENENRGILYNLFPVINLKKG